MADWQPPTVESFVFECAPSTSDQSSLKVTAKRFIPNPPPNEGLTLLFTHCVGGHKEQWEPTIFRLFEKARVSNFSGNTVHQAWTLDWPSHGDAAIVNSEIINERDYCISSYEWVSVIVTLLKKLVAEGHRVVGIGHSAGAGSILLPIKSFSSTQLPYVSLILVEPTLISGERFMAERQVHEPKTAERVKATFSRRDTWPSREDAFIWLHARFPWKLWHPDVLRIYVNHGLRSVNDDVENGQVTLKCPKKVEGITYPDYPPLLEATALMVQACRFLPIHMIFGTRNDFVSAEHQDDLCTASAHGVYRSVKRISGAGHMIVQERPFELADAISEILYSSPRSRL